MYGGVSGVGTVFKINPDGTQFATLYTFNDVDDGPAANPYGLLAVTNDAVYGTASGLPSGTVFRVNINGTGQTPLHIFSGGIDGDETFGGVVLSSNTLYGISGQGVVFKVNTDGTGFQILHCLACETNVGATQTTTFAGLALASNYLYGTTFTGGANNLGFIFKVNTNGTEFKVLHDFEGSDGENPWAGLLAYNDKLYGTTMSGGGDNTVGTIFSINTDGSGFTNLHRFTGLAGNSPQSGLICNNNVLYGTASAGGGIDKGGTVFALNTDGTGYTNLYIFSGGLDGSTPTAGLTLSGNYLYGTTSLGGTSSNGTIFRLSLPLPTPAAITRSGSNMLVSWTTNSSGQVLQASTNLSDWVTLSNSPVIMNGHYTLTNAISGPQRFFRLNR
jgi:uncharacterized repeat protein (TIGR03803 family)